MATSWCPQLQGETGVVPGTCPSSEPPWVLFLVQDSWPCWIPSGLRLLRLGRGAPDASARWCWGCWGFFGP